MMVRGLLLSTQGVLESGLLGGEPPLPHLGPAGDTRYLGGPCSQHSWGKWVVNLYPYGYKCIIVIRTPRIGTRL